MFTHLFIQIVTIRLCLKNLIYNYITHYHTHEKSGTIKKQILNLSDGQLLTLIEIEPNVNEKVSLFSNTIINILSNFIHHETIVCDDKDPPWFNKAINLSFKKKKHIQNISPTQ